MPTAVHRTVDPERKKMSDQEELEGIEKATEDTDWLDDLGYEEIKPDSQSNK